MDVVDQVQWHVVRERYVPVKLYNEFAQRDDIPTRLKQKLARYQKLCKHKLLHGSGFKINIDDNHNVAFMIGDKEVTGFHAMTTSTQPLPPDVAYIKVGNDSYQLDFEKEPIGHGSFAAVYDLQPKTNKDLVAKVFYNANVDVISKCIQEFISNYQHSEIFRPYNTTTLYVDDGEFTFYDVAKRGDGTRKAYIMPKYSGSLKSVLGSVFDSVKHGHQTNFEEQYQSAINMLKDVIHNLETCKNAQISKSERFVHGDIKLDNIVHDSMGKTYIHDWDGVYTYDTSSFLHVNEKPYRRGVFLSPSSTHPFMLL